MPEARYLPTVADLEDAVAAKDAEIADLQRQLEHWRTRAIVGWSEGTAAPSQAARLAHLEGELVAMRLTLSWRLTAPLRVARGVRSRLRRVVRAVIGR